ncbi:recombinase family protein [Ensifer sp. IC4062]|nr:recombinase family protein [Ensifer sp. IC4062]MCA1442687.1 recombinase family protein [Ensifer sp. IC4062]
MSRTFAYCRVSTTDQTTENQVLEIANKGFVVEPHRIVTETVSGSKPAKERPGFQKLLERMEKGDKLIITKLDRLGRDSIDVLSTLKQLTEAGIEVHCIALAGFNLGSAMGGLVMQMFAAMAQFERDLLIERTHAGLARAKSQGKTLGRPKSLTEQQKEEARQAVKNGASFRSVAKSMGVSHATIMRVCEAI